MMLAYRIGRSKLTFQPMVVSMLVPKMNILFRMNSFCIRFYNFTSTFIYDECLTILNVTLEERKMNDVYFKISEAIEIVLNRKK